MRIPCCDSAKTVAAVVVEYGWLELPGERSTLPLGTNFNSVDLGIWSPFQVWKNPAMDNQREFYRIRYRERDCPIIKVAGHSLSVLDLSEGGAFISRCEPFREGTEPLAVEIVFSDKQTVETIASFLRQDDEHVAIRFSPLIPMSIIFAEQRRLLRLYPPAE